MSIRMLAAVATLLVHAACLGAPDTYMGMRVQHVDLTIAGGKTITIHVTDGSPIPAEDEDYKIQVAGFNIEPADDDPHRPMLTWRFALTVKQDIALERVAVEEVFPVDVARPVIEDASQPIWHPRTVVHEGMWPMDSQEQVLRFRGASMHRVHRWSSSLPPEPDHGVCRCLQGNRPEP